MKNNDSEIYQENTTDGIKFVIKGRLNSDNSDGLHDLLQKALNDGHKNIILNMLQVDFLSSAGIRVLLRAYQEAKDAGGNFGIEMPSKRVKNVLGMTALDELLFKKS